MLRLSPRRVPRKPVEYRKYVVSRVEAETFVKLPTTLLSLFVVPVVVGGGVEVNVGVGVLVEKSKRLLLECPVRVVYNLGGLVYSPVRVPYKRDSVLVSDIRARHHLDVDTVSDIRKSKRFLCETVCKVDDTKKLARMLKYIGYID